MGLSDTVLAVIVFLLFLMRIFLSLSEASLLAVNKVTVRHLVEKKVKKAQILSTLLTRADHFLPTLLLLTLLADVAAGALTTSISLGHLPFGAAIATGVLTMVLFVYAELIPKSFAINNSERVALFVCRPVNRVTTLLFPVVYVFIKIADLSNKVFGGKSIESTPFVTEEEIKTMVDVGGEEGSIEEEERDLIHSIFEFGDTVAREAMVPRIDMVTVEISSDIKDVLSLIAKEGHSRIPVFEKTIDNVVGIIYAKDILNQIAQKKENISIKKLMRPAHHISETQKLNDILKELQQKRQHMAIVVDEYGQTAGLITIEDLLEEIVGEIFDEYDFDKQPVERLDENTVRVDAKISASDLEDIFGIEVPEDLEVDTIGGFVTDLAGRLPKRGEVVTYENLEFTVEKTREKRVEVVLIHRYITEEEVEGSEEVPAVDEAISPGEAVRSDASASGAGNGIGNSKKRQNGK